jgi:hypothetical protein
VAGSAGRLAAATHVALSGTQAPGWRSPQEHLDSPSSRSSWPRPLLVVGVLGGSVLVNVGTRQADLADGRVAATNLMRQLLEDGAQPSRRRAPLRTCPAALQAAWPDLAGAVAGDAAWTVRRATRVFTVAVCEVADPADGTADSAARTADFCAQPAASKPPDAAPPTRRALRSRSAGPLAGKRRPSRALPRCRSGSAIFPVSTRLR